MPCRRTATSSRARPRARRSSSFDAGNSRRRKPMTTQSTAAPAIVRPGAIRDSIRVEPLTCAIGAEISNVSLADAVHDDALLGEIHELWMRHKVLFFRDQDISRAEHVAFARRF